jgi:hypothetical protein
MVIDLSALEWGWTMLTTAELTKARVFLQKAHASVLWVASAFFNDDDAATASRMNDIAARLVDEMAAVDTTLKGLQP